MEIKGKIIKVLEAKNGVSTKTGNPWAMQEYVIEIPGQFPKKVAFTVFGEDKIRQFNIKVGDDLVVYIDIDAAEYNGKWYNRITAYNVTRDRTAEPPLPMPTTENSNDLPFL